MTSVAGLANQELVLPFYRMSIRLGYTSVFKGVKNRFIWCCCQSTVLCFLRGTFSSFWKSIRYSPH